MPGGGAGEAVDPVEEVRVSTEKAGATLERQGVDGVVNILGVEGNGRQLQRQERAVRGVNRDRPEVDGAHRGDPERGQQVDQRTRGQNLLIDVERRRTRQWRRAHRNSGRGHDGGAHHGHFGGRLPGRLELVGNFRRVHCPRPSC